jgi:hypothetical protein
MSRAQDLFDRLVAGDEAEVLSFIADRVTEELFLDYKRSADDGAGTALHNKDRSSLAKGISGFGNSEGGVIVWGVECKPDPNLGDVPTKPIPIQNAARFKSWLEQATSGLTVPPHDGVRHHAIQSGFALSLIPSGLHAPYQTVADNSYYIRAGSSFARAPHAVLSGIFGRRPQPVIKHHFLVYAPTLGNGTVRTRMGLVLRNFGRGIATDIFLNLTLTSHPGRNCKINFAASEQKEVWTDNVLLEHRMQMMTRADVRLAPEADLMPLSLDVLLQEPIERDFSFRGMCGCGGGEPSRFGFTAEVGDIVNAFVPAKIPQDAPDAPFAARRFNERFYRALEEQK